MLIGSHVSMSKGLIGAAKEANSYGASTFMIYTGAPQNTRRSPISKLKIEEGWQFMKEAGIDSFVVHAPYIMNLASFKDDLFNMSVEFLAEELRRTEALGSDYLVMHPGSFTEKDLDYGINRIAQGLNMVLENEVKPSICLETMAGKGSEVGRTFEELKQIIDKVEKGDRINVCLDTCHIHDAGYDIINDFDGVMQQFDSVLGIDKLKVLHINGSLNKPGAKKDRHANIGAGADNPRGADQIGFDVIYNIVHSKYCKDKYLILETPWIDDKTNLYKEEIAALKGNLL